MIEIFSALFVSILLFACQACRSARGKFFGDFFFNFCAGAELREEKRIKKCLMEFSDDEKTLKIFRCKI
jgi:hypothetical protein